jgi:predicted nucleic acid-binding protein
LKTVFADTFYWIALTYTDDASHPDAVAFDASPDRSPITTTEEILIEFLTFFGGQGVFLRTKALAVTRHILSAQNITVLPQTHETFSTGLDLYATRLDKGYSMTDCISMQAMRREGLTDVLTNDRHFEQEGFRALFRS